MPKLDDALVRNLKRRAAEHGHSAEKEHREILRQALESPPHPPFREALLAMPDIGDDTDFARDDDRGRDIEW